MHVDRPKIFHDGRGTAPEEAGRSSRYGKYDKLSGQQEWNGKGHFQL